MGGQAPPPALTAAATAAGSQSVWDVCVETDRPWPLAATPMAASRLTAYGSPSASQARRPTRQAAQALGSSTAGSPRRTMRREPRARREASRSARASKRKPSRLGPTASGLRKCGSRQKTGKRAVAPVAASSKAGLSCRRRPLRNQSMVRSGGGGGAMGAAGWRWLATRASKKPRQPGRGVGRAVRVHTSRHWTEGTPAPRAVGWARVEAEV